MNVFQINDEDGNSLGLLTTSLEEDKIVSLYREFCLNEDYDDVQGDIDEFIVMLQDKEPEGYFERYFIDGVIYAPNIGYETYLKNKEANA